MARSASSKRWLQRQQNDKYTNLAKQEGYRSRAAYKLLELQKKDKLIQPGMTVVDLGAAPGGWSQVAKKFVGKNGKIIALDILPIDPIQDVEVLQGDFREVEVYETLLAQVNSKPVDCIIADLAPNFSGIRDMDAARAVYLNEITLDFALQVLAPGGSLLLKSFQGPGFEEFLRDLRCNFAKVVSRKPDASRKESKEIYLVAKKFGKDKVAQ